MTKETITLKCTFLVLAGLLVTLYQPSSHANETNTINLEASSNSTKDTAKNVDAAFSNYIPWVSNLVRTNYRSTATTVLTDAKTNVLTALTNSALPEMGQAGKFLVELKKSGRLPGVLADSHGELSVNGPLSAFQEAKYPFTVTFDLNVKGDSLTNHYTVVRQVKDAEWQLEKAWRTDAQGHTAIEWPVK